MLIFKILYIFGFSRLFRLLFQRNRLTILIYHNPSKDAIEKHILFLQKNYTLLSLDEALIKLKGNCLPKYPLVITFDDGHVDNFKLLSTFKKYGVIPTIFLTSDIVCTEKPFWFNHKDQIQLSGENLKKIDNNVRLDLMKKSGFDSFKAKYREALSADEILEMSSFVDFQCHTSTHPILPNCSEDVSFVEMSNSKLKLEKLLGRKVNGFAYPNGDYTDREIEYCADIGYKYAVTIDQDFNTSLTPRYMLKRIGTNDAESLEEFIIRSSGLWAWIKRRFS